MGGPRCRAQEIVVTGEGYYKICSRCKDMKIISEFGKNPSNSSGFDSWCKLCSYFGEIHRRYGVDEPAYRTMWDNQDGRCAICRADLILDLSLKPNLDHCHHCGKFRGLLCERCNLGLGNFRDSVGFLETAIAYLKGNTCE